MTRDQKISYKSVFYQDITTAVKSTSLTEISVFFSVYLIFDTIIVSYVYFCYSAILLTFFSCFLPMMQIDILLRCLTDVVKERMYLSLCSLIH